MAMCVVGAGVSLGVIGDYEVIVLLPSEQFGEQQTGSKGRCGNGSGTAYIDWPAASGVSA